MMVEIPAVLLSAFPPSADLLLECVRRGTDDSMLTVIARADYGNEADAMMVELRSIRDSGRIPSPMSFMLGEVLTLTHYADPDAPNPPPFEPGPTGPSGHHARLFACAVLLQVEAEAPIEYRLHTDSALARALVSTKVLGEELSMALARHLTWRMSRREDHGQALLLAVALLILANRLRAGRFEEPDLGVVARWVLALESEGRSEIRPGFGEPRPLAFGVCAGFWAPLLAELKLEASAIRDADVRTDVELCGLLLDPGW